ncbi:hypothetical protein [Marinobacter sp. AL4B]|uniref:hypothetical protein n=1 Tax=Marinobacter sp. AL4B TaxID=2871173 RepID=UPI001CAA7689|nr:hypothetical protein [Marinobacter sp. AL4B]MBZ0333687.1 hypothetical protein [Marinobacter sp. AL4B]
MKTSTLKSSIFSLVITSTFCFHSILAVGAPNIQDVSGELQHGSSLTIRGGGFGESQAAKHALWDTVENQPEFEALNSGADVPTDRGPWERNGSPWAKPVTLYRGSDQRHQHSSANYLGLEKAFLGVPSAFSDSTNKNIYVSWWFKPSGDINEFGGANKLIRIWDSLDGKDTRISWTQALLGAYKDGSEWDSWAGKSGVWNRLEIFANGEKGTIKAWTNGKIIHSVSDFEKSTIQDGLTVWLIGFDPNYDVYESLEIKMDDIFISSSPERIELSTSQYWSEAGSKKEIQPVVSWNDSEISIKLNLGQFDKNDDLYIYVVTKDESVNENGIRLNNEPCKKCPSSPSSVGIE